MKAFFVVLIAAVCVASVLAFDLNQMSGDGAALLNNHCNRAIARALDASTGSASSGSRMAVLATCANIKRAQLEARQQNKEPNKVMKAAVFQAIKEGAMVEAANTIQDAQAEALLVEVREAIYKFLQTVLNVDLVRSD